MSNRQADASDRHIRGQQILYTATDIGQAKVMVEEGREERELKRVNIDKEANGSSEKRQIIKTATHTAQNTIT